MKSIVLVLALLAGVAHANNVCPGLTRVPNCSECRGSTCLYCATGYGEVWAGSGATLKVMSCTRATACPAGAAYANCARCVPAPDFPTQPTCIACKTVVNRVSNIGFQKQDKKLVWAAGANFGRCVTASAAVVANNINCKEYNPDGTCKLCTRFNVVGTQRELVVPTNAIFTNGVFPMSSCNTRGAMRAMSVAAIGKDMTPDFIPAECAEVGSDFKCARCLPNSAMVVVTAQGKTRHTCVARTAAQTRAKLAANGCNPLLAFQEYCQRCQKANVNRCELCVPGRSTSVAGFCSLPCKQLFGVSCARCSATACTGVDPAFPKGRR